MTKDLGKILLVAVLVALAVGEVFLALVPPGPHHVLQEHSDSTQQQDQGATATRDAEDQKPFWGRTTHDPVAFFTAILDALTFILASVAVFQIWFLRQSDKTARISADAAKAAAEALPTVERGYLFISALDQTGVRDAVAENADEPRNPMMPITVKNYGKTPVFLERTGVALHVDGGFDLTPVYQTKGVVLGPGDTHDLVAHYYGTPIGVGVAFQIRNGQFPLRFKFTLQYRDIFGKLHETDGDWRYFATLDEFHPDEGAHYENAT